MPSIADRVQETTATTGTGTLSLGGAVSGFQAFSSAFVTGESVQYCVTSAAGDWEVGIGTYTSGSPGTLSRDTILGSSNSGALVSLPSGSKSVFCTATAAGLARAPSGYRIVLVAGQSNAQGQGATIDSTVDVGDPGLFQWPCYASHPQYGNIVALGTSGLSFPDNMGAGVIGPGDRFSVHYSRAVGAPVLLVPAAVGATQMHNSVWMPSMTPGAGGTYFENAITQANNAIAFAKAIHPGSYFDGFIWCQGETDGDNGVTYSQYSADLTLLISSFRARITGASKSWALILSMPYETMQYYAGTIPIHYAHIDVAAATTRCKFAPSSRGDTIAPGSNRHRTPAGVRKAGGTLASLVQAAAYKFAAEVQPSPIQVTGVATSGVTGAGATVTWTTAYGADDYKVEYSSDSGTTWTAATRLWGDSTTLALTGLTASTSYLVRVTGSWRGTYGTASSSASFTTLAGSPPTITAQPTNQSASSGSTATFSVTATGATAYQWQRSTDSGTTWANVTTGTGGTTSSYTTPATTSTGGTANNGDQYRCVVSNAYGSVNSSAATLTVSVAVTYDFEADTVGNPPANTTTNQGTWVVASPTISGATYGKSLRCSASNANQDNAISFTNANLAGNNQRATWRRGVTTVGQSRDGVILRPQSSASGGSYTHVQQGYWFHIAGTTNTLFVYKMTSTGPTSLNSAAFTDAADQWFRASITGTTLTFDTSPDGTTWTNKLTLTDATFSTSSAACQYAAGAGATDVTTFYLDSIKFELI